MRIKFVAAVAGLMGISLAFLSPDWKLVMSKFWNGSSAKNFIHSDMFTAYKK